MEAASVEVEDGDSSQLALGEGSLRRGLLGDLELVLLLYRFG